MLPAMLPLLLLVTAASALRPSMEGLAAKPFSEIANQITELPGLEGEPPSEHYSGYIPVDPENNEKQLFYWLVSSEGSVKKDPVVLWLTGGPGCSAMDAFVYEHGPFTFSYKEADNEDDEAEITLHENPYSWSKAATMIYVDSPAGAGMSYSTNPEQDYKTNDTITINDLYSFLQTFYEEFPSLRSNDLYIAGESYGGVYVPLLAKKITDMNQQAEGEAVYKDAKGYINLKGYMVGNAVTDDEIDGNAQLDFALNMGLIDPIIHEDVSETCKGIFWNASKQDNECTKAVKDAYDTFYWVNPYNILGPCYSAKNAKGRKEMEVHSPMSHMFSADRSQHMLKHAVPCADRRAALDYMNRGEVRAAIHAVPAEEVDWQPCSDVLHYETHVIHMVDTHVELLKRGLRVLVYSGDHDFVIPYIGTRSWVYNLNMRVDRPYAAYLQDDQVAGFSTTFEGGLTFAIVKGAGHMVPQTNPKEALMLISRFLAGDL